MTHEQPPIPGGGDEQPAASEPPLEPAEQLPPEADTSPAAPPPDAELHEDESTNRPRIWAGSLADYNNGILHGAWIDAAHDPEEIRTDIDAMLAASPWTARTGEPAEEWGVFDTDNFGACRIGQHEDLDWISAVARGIAEHGPAFAAWVDVMEEPDFLSEFETAYLGEYDSLEAYAEELIDELGYDELLDRVVPPSLRPYVQINIAGFAQDMWLNGEVHIYHRPGGGVWIFHGQ
jgi:antirestriction protein